MATPIITNQYGIRIKGGEQSATTVLLPNGQVAPGGYEIAVAYGAWTASEHLAACERLAAEDDVLGRMQVLALCRSDDAVFTAIREQRAYLHALWAAHQNAVPRKPRG